MMRHAKSAWNFEGMEDHDRPLNARGRKSAVAVAQELVYTRRCLPSLVLSSTARRTQETWECMCLGVPELSDLSEVSRRLESTTYITAHEPSLSLSLVILIIFV